MKTIEERASLAAWQIFEEIGLSQHSVERVSEIIEEKILEQKAIDEEVRLKKCDDMTKAEYDREVAFADWYNKNGKGTPTYSDAIEWARKETIDNACQWLDNNASEYATFAGGDLGVLKKITIDFRKAMELKDDKDNDDEVNEGQALLYAVNKTEERVKRKMIKKACEWLKARNVLTDASLEDFIKMMED